MSGSVVVATSLRKTNFLMSTVQILNLFNLMFVYQLLFIVWFITAGWGHLGVAAREYVRISKNVPSIMWWRAAFGRSIQVNVFI